MSETDRAYLAGIIDGEGCITGYIGRYRSPTARHGAGRNDRSFILKVDIANTDRRLIDWIQERWPGGHVTLAPRKELHPEWKDVYHWCTTNAPGVKTIIEAALPYLVLKRTQAMVALDLAASTRNTGRAGYTEAEVAARVALYEQLRTLNRKGNAA